MMWHFLCDILYLWRFCNASSMWRFFNLTFFQGDVFQSDAFSMWRFFNVTFLYLTFLHECRQNLTVIKNISNIGKSRTTNIGPQISWYHVTSLKVDHYQFDWVKNEGIKTNRPNRNDNVSFFGVSLLKKKIITLLESIL